MTLGYGEIKKGLPIELDGEPYTVVEYNSSKMQQRAPVMRIRFKSLRTGQVVDKTFNGYDVKFTPAAIDRQNARYIYEDGGLYYFMDEETFDQFPLSLEQVEEALPYMVEQTVAEVVFYEGNPISIDLPITVDLKVDQTDPGFKGDTAQGGTKPATLETGLVATVPLFVEVGDIIRIDTRSGAYISRV